MSLPINVDNLHYATQDKIERLSKEGFSINRYKREKNVHDEHDIWEDSVTDLVNFCEENSINPESAVIDSDCGVGSYGPPILTYSRLETDQEAAQRAIESWEERVEKEQAKQAQEEEEKRILRELAKKYPDEMKK